MKYNILVILFLILLTSTNTAICNNNYIINKDTVYIDNPKVYLSATPHTLASSGWVYFNLTSKVYTGNIDACWGFNTFVSKPTKAEVYSPYWVNTTINHEKTFYNSTFQVYTGNDLDYGNSYNTNYRYTINESIVNDNGTTYIISNAAFDSFNTDGTNYTIYWDNRYNNYYLWKDFSSSFNSVIYNYEGFNKWYYIKNVPITSNKEYTVRSWIDVPVSTKKQSGKYYFAIKPSGETISQAINEGHFYNLDPWWNATWSNRKNITLTGNTSGAQTDYQILLNVTYDSDMQSDFDDLRFCNETHGLDSWLESKVDGSYALIWVKFPTTPANGVNQTYYMYYGNVWVANYWDGDATFQFFDDFGGAFPDTKWTGDTGYGSVSGGILTYAGAAGGAWHGIFSANQYTPDYAMRGKFKSQAAHAKIGFEKSGTAAGRSIVYASNVYSYNDSGVDFDITSSVYNYDTWYTFDIKQKSGTSAKFCINDGLVATHTNHVGTIAENASISSYQNIHNISVDWLFVSKYTANPPTYAFGSEEHYIPEGPTTLIEETGLIMSEITSGLKGVNMSNYLVYAFILIGILLIILVIQIIGNGIYRG